MPKQTKKESYTSRLIAPMQSTGRCGKSTFVQCLIDYLAFAGVDAAAIDADASHRTLNQWISNVPHIPFNNPEDLQPILNHCGQTPVEIIDFPAQATDNILAALSTYRAREIFAEKNVRLTIPLFASDERVAMLSAAKIVQATKSYADYLLVFNPSRFSSQVFLGSEKLMEMIGDAPRISMLPLTAATTQQIDEQGKLARKALTLQESLATLPIASRMEVQTFINSVYCDLEDAAASIVPDTALIQNKVHRETKAEAHADLNPFDL